MTSQVGLRAEATGFIHTYWYNLMTNIEARAIVTAREKLKRAQKEFAAAQLRDTHYRGVQTFIVSEEPADVHGTFVYRGITYTK